VIWNPLHSWCIHGVLGRSDLAALLRLPHLAFCRSIDKFLFVCLDMFDSESDLSVGDLSNEELLKSG